MRARSLLWCSFLLRGAIYLPLGFLTTSTAHGDDISDAELSRATQQVSVVVTNARTNLLPLMSGTARDTDARVTYGFVNSWNSNAQATPTGKILISGGITWVLQMVTESLILDGRPHFKGCGVEYIDYVADTLNMNSQRIGERLRAQPLFPPAYARSKGIKLTKCPQSGKGIIFSEQEQDAIRNAMTNSLIFLWLHELAHHALDHVATRVSVDEQRKRESAADVWAIKEATRANYYMLYAQPVLLFLSVVNSGTLEDEKEMDHPLGVKRFDVVYEALRAELQHNDKFVEMLQDGQSDKFWAEFDRQINVLRASVSSLK